MTLYYDHVKGADTGALLQGRRVSSLTFEPHWRDRAWPAKGRYAVSATDQALGLTA